MATDILPPPVDGVKPFTPTNVLPSASRPPKLKDSKWTTDGDSSSPSVTTKGQRPQTDQPPLKDHKSNVHDTTHARYPRISRPVELMRTAYDVVVIGSGYGGGVAASRMARGRQSVCLLERGKEKWPGEYPEELHDALKELHVSGEFAPWKTKGKWTEGGDPTGLYHLVVGEGQNAFVGNGLGGTSLLNANVFLEADQQVLDMNCWPAELKDESAWKKCTLFFSPTAGRDWDVSNGVLLTGDRFCLQDIDTGLDLISTDYGRARGVLEPASYPPDFPDLPKLDLLQRQADLMGLGDKFYRVPQTTRFVDGPNSTGVEMHASTLTGMDATGINDGSKSTTLVNYLSDAWNWGAEMFCECEVRYIKAAPDGEGYIVYFAWYGGKRGAFKENIYEDLMWVHARKCVFLGAGSLGTTEILLRSKQMGLKMSDSIGTGMSGNGDILAFGYNTDYDVNSVGRPSPSPERPIGPCITGVIDCRNQRHPLDGFIIEEGTVPQALAPFFEAMLEQLPGRIAPKGLGVFEKVEHLLARQGSKLLGPYFRSGSTEKTQVYLIMSHDSNQATLTLQDDRPILKFLGVGRSEHVKYLDSVLAKVTNAVGGTYMGSPFWSALGQQEITVHAIGGACISSDGTGSNGGTNHMGEVLQGEGTEVHEGLVVCDGALIPTALGANPFATITALAERSVELAAKKRGIDIDFDTSNGILNLYGKPRFPLVDDAGVKTTEKLIDVAEDDQTSGIGFTEVMSGFIHIGDDVQDFELATKIARSGCEAARFFLSVKSWDTEDLVSSSAHSAMLTGSFSCAGLKGPFMVHRGDFQLFNQDSREPTTRNLTYNFEMISPSREKLYFNGYKVVNPSVAFDPIGFWKATSTLYATITVPDGQVIGRGTLYIKPADFVSELATLEPSGRNLYAKARSVASFLTYFTREATKIFFAPLTYLQWPSPTFHGYSNATEISETFTVTASDGVHSTMQMWNPLGSDVSTARLTILFVPGAAVDYQIFGLPTIEKNAIDYFREAGYRIYCVTHRVGKTMTAMKGSTTFDARLDILAALAKIREQEAQRNGHADKIYVIAHCAGSVALSMGLLDGSIPAGWIKGITASNVFMNPIFANVNLAKASLPIPMNNLYNKLAGSWFSCTSSPSDSLIQQILNQVLRFYPVGSKAEICNSVVCHRSSLVFGRLWTHKSLNAPTHAQLANFLGGTSMRSLGHLMSMGRSGYVTTNPPTSINLVSPYNIARLEGIPIFFFSGANNAVYAPESTDVSYTMLRDAHGPDGYERVVFEGRGHLDCWMGVTAHMDVYPKVREHVDKVMLGRS